MNWKPIERPGFFGKERDKIFTNYNKRFGKGNWDIAWKWNGEIIPYEKACLLYEYGYYADSFKREDLWKELTKEAKEVYDQEENNIKSGLDYSIQKGTATHLQDIAIRRVLSRRGWKFKGNKLIQIRSHSEYWGKNLSPGKIPFHIPKLIEKPHIGGWWDLDSIEDFYQSNKVLLKKEK